jgi:putative glycosyltransferase (TIGR04348 family)
MNILITTPAPPRSRYGNRVTALRWARILKEIGHHVTVSQVYEDGDYDLLVALHARRSYPSINRFHHLHPDKPLIVALSGTDLYRDINQSKVARESLELSTRIIALQPKAFDDLSPRLHAKTRIIYQSAHSVRTGRPLSPNSNRHSDDMTGSRNFTVCVIGHLRPVKDPFRTALAARLLPPSSRIRVLHVGGAMSDGMAARARAEMEKNPRYLWLGEQPRWRTRRILARSHLCVLSSRMEGGANALSESIVASVPVIASRIPGTVGILGEDYPGYFNVGDTRELRRLLIRAEADPDFLSLLRSKCDELAGLFEPEREQKAWKDLLGELRRPGLVRTASK